MENIKIWHEPTEYPSEEARIVVWMDGDQDTAHYYITWLKDKVVITEQGFTYPWERVDRWAYFDQVMAASKALDVAIKRLEELSTYQCQDSERATRLRMRVCAATGLTEINLLMNMKGGK